jgi:hypothetical protein
MALPIRVHRRLGRRQRRSLTCSDVTLLSNRTNLRPGGNRIPPTPAACPRAPQRPIRGPSWVPPMMQSYLAVGRLAGLGAEKTCRRSTRFDAGPGQRILLASSLKGFLLLFSTHLTPTRFPLAVFRQTEESCEPIASCHHLVASQAGFTCRSTKSTEYNPSIAPVSNGLFVIASGVERALIYLS